MMPDVSLSRFRDIARHLPTETRFQQSGNIAILTNKSSARDTYLEMFNHFQDYLDHFDTHALIPKSW